MRINVIDTKERIATGIALTAEQRDFVLDCINEATAPQPEISELKAHIANDQHRLFHYECVIANYTLLVTRLREALGFARSAIKSGETWTERCEEMITRASEANRDVRPETPVR